MRWKSYGSLWVCARFTGELKCIDAVPKRPFTRVRDTDTAVTETRPL